MNGLYERYSGLWGGKRQNECRGLPALAGRDHSAYERLPRGGNRWHPIRHHRDHLHGHEQSYALHDEQQRDERGQWHIVLRDNRSRERIYARYRHSHDGRHRHNRDGLQRWRGQHRKRDGQRHHHGNDHLAGELHQPRGHLRLYGW